MKAELTKYPQKHFTVADNRLDLFAHFHEGRLHGSLPCQPALPVLHSHAEHASLAAKLFVFGIEERIFLKAPAVKRHGAGGDHRLPRFVCRAEPQLDLALQNRRAHEGWLLIASVLEDSDHGDYY
jgi:hypothetical protein